VCGLAHTIGSWGYGWSSCLISFLRVGGICLSHDEVKRAVGLFYGFVSAIASAPCSFLYLNNEYLNIKIK